MATSNRPVAGEDIDERLAELYDRHMPLRTDAVATYYEPGHGYCPVEYTTSSHDQFAIAIATLDGTVHSVGDDHYRFGLQSVAKVITYGLALEDRGRDYVLRHVGVEPSGEAFNSIQFDERHNRPYNPMVNAGAIVTTSLLEGRDIDAKRERLVGSVRAYADNPNIEIDQRILTGELAANDRNRGTTYLMRAAGMLGGDVDDTLRLYLEQCAIDADCRDVAMMAATLANGGSNPRSGQRCLPQRSVRDVLSVMYTCGMYDFAGQWAYEVGVPAKSGVSGAIMCVIPGKMGIAVFSPGLDENGNSVRGTRVCRDISRRLGLHVFASDSEDKLLGG